MITQTETPYALRVVRLPDDTECWQVRAMLDTGEVIASVKMRTLRECSCIGIVFHLETREDHRRRGVASLMLAELETIARRENVSMLLLTVRKYNHPCRLLMEKQRYTWACEWNNGRTGNDLVLGRKVLRLSSE